MLLRVGGCNFDMHVIKCWDVQFWLRMLLRDGVCNCDCACYYGLGCAIVTVHIIKGWGVQFWLCMLLWVGVCNCDCACYYGLGCAIVTLHVIKGWGVQLWLCMLLRVGVCNCDCAYYWGLGCAIVIVNRVRWVVNFILRPPYSSLCEHGKHCKTLGESKMCLDQLHKKKSLASFSKRATIHCLYYEI
jgi:hypothetical protein